VNRSRKVLPQRGGMARPDARLRRKRSEIELDDDLAARVRSVCTWKAEPPGPAWMRWFSPGWLAFQPLDAAGRGRNTEAAHQLVPSPRRARRR